MNEVKNPVGRPKLSMPDKAPEIEKVEEKIEVKAVASAKPELKFVDLKIELGKSADKIVINDYEFHHGTTVRVREDLVPVLREVMYNTQMHDKIVSGDASPSGRNFQGGRR